MARKVIRSKQPKLRHLELPLVDSGVADLVAPFVAAGDPHMFYGSVFKLSPALVTVDEDGEGSSKRETHDFMIELVTDVQLGENTKALLLLAHHTSEFADAPDEDSESIKMARKFGVYFDGYIPCPVFKDELEALTTIAAAALAVSEGVKLPLSGLQERTFDNTIRAVTIGVLDLLGYELTVEPASLRA